MPACQQLQRLRPKDHLSPEVWGQTGQQSETLSHRKQNKQQQQKLTNSTKYVLIWIDERWLFILPHKKPYQINDRIKMSILK